MDDEIVRAGSSLLGLGRNDAPREFVFGELKQLPTATRQDHLALRFLGHLARMPEKRAVKRFFLQRMVDVDTDATAWPESFKLDPQCPSAARSWCVRMRAVLYKYNIAFLWSRDALEEIAAIQPKDEWEEFTDLRIKHTEAGRWRQRQLGVSRFGPIYWALKHRPGLDPYLRVSHRAAPSVRSIARLRAGIVGEVHWGRWCKAPNLPRSERRCCLCCPDDVPMQRVRQHHLDGLRLAAEKRRQTGRAKRHGTAAPGGDVSAATYGDVGRVGQRVSEP